MGSAVIPLRWIPREPPLAPAAVFAQGAIARALARRLLRRDDEGLARMRAVAGAEVLLVMGPEPELPWVDGVTYLGRDMDAPALLLPTFTLPDVPLPLLEEAVLARVAGVPPVVVVPQPPLLLAGGEARPLDRGALETWLAR